MNGAHWHLVTNHLPLIIPIFGILIMLAGKFLKSAILKRTAYCFFILAALSAVVAMSTGEEAEEVLERVNGIEKSFIEEHEETAEIFSIILYALGVVSIVGLWANWRKKSFSRIMTNLSLSLAILAFFYAKLAANSGGEIRHIEIRNKGIENTIPANLSHINDHQDD